MHTQFGMVSIIMPAYNAEKTLAQAVSSALVLLWNRNADLRKKILALLILSILICSFFETDSIIFTYSEFDVFPKYK